MKLIRLIVLVLCLQGTSIQIAGQMKRSSFELTPGIHYVISGWVQELHDSPQITYNSEIAVLFKDQNGTPLETFTFDPSGAIIDAWQRIIGDFVVPVAASSMEIRLVNRCSFVSSEPVDASEVLGNISGSRVYFDDIRIHPFNGNAKSFVYDAQTQRLLAELDENNYATFYDYDKEGGLVRVKKETEKGIYTVQETRSSTVKN